MRPAGAAAHFAAVLVLAGFFDAGPIAPWAAASRLGYEQAAQTGADQAGILEITVFARPPAPCASFRSILDHRHYHRRIPPLLSYHLIRGTIEIARDGHKLNLNNSIDIFIKPYKIFNIFNTNINISEYLLKNSRVSTGRMPG
jgi:hypothetical protein